MPEFLLSLVTEFAGPFVDLLISGLGWKKDEQQKLKQLKKQLLETVANTIEYLTSTKISPARRHYITKQWNELAIDLEAYEHLRKRVEDFARATEDSDKWNNSQKLALAIRLNAFRASILKTNCSDLQSSAPGIANINLGSQSSAGSGAI